MNVRTRFAPSPTGELHIGGIRTALYAYAYAKKHNGEFILRIEDTDRKRFVEGSIQNIVSILDEYDIPADRSPDTQQIEKAEEEGTKDISESDWILRIEELEQVNEDYYESIYIQSQRLPLYQKYAWELLKNGYAYICFASGDELTKLREDAQNRKEKFIYRGELGKFTYDEAYERITSGEKFVVRLDVRAYIREKGVESVEYQGTSFPLAEVDDQVLMKSDGIPTYHLAVVVDDHFMGITHAMRAAEWIPSTPKQILTYEALGWDMPEYIHLTAILNSNSKGKLSKRDGSVAAGEFLLEGYLPHAILNFLMLLGWSSPEEREHGEKEREFYTLEDFIELFDTENLNKSNPVFNRDKLVWFNQKYIHMLKPDQFVLTFTQWLENYGDDTDLKNSIIEHGPDYLESSLVLVQERCKVLSELPDLISPFYTYPEKSAVYKVVETTKQTNKLDKSTIDSFVSAFCSELEQQSSVKKWGHESWETFVRTYAESNELKAGQLFMTLRIVILGTPFSPPLFESMEVLEKETILERLA